MSVCPLTECPQAERVADLRAWANSRINHCRSKEDAPGFEVVRAQIESERRTLEAVLRILDRE